MEFGTIEPPKVEPPTTEPRTKAPPTLLFPSNLLEIKFVSVQSRIDSCRPYYSKYVPTEDPVKEAIKFYKDFDSSLKLEYGPQSKKSLAFRKWYRDCKEDRITIYKFEWKMQWLLKSQLKLLNEFYSTVLPYLYPLATEDEVDRANQFIRSVKSAFPNDRGLWARVCTSVLQFQGGYTTLKQMTVEVQELLGNRDDLIEAYIKFVPEAQKFISKGRFLSYPVIVGLLVASAVGFSKMMK
ncbi:hypothetical protein POM88_038696 [Heracleum sosnowskyi]|uniref:Uncharacterized protein n=1 Tax=Heracleum sosnowskyi TaxID=360622 RepID=A0AAD8M5R0_9APIA|nr:hypothetical protein POM88_038696 [Heracleum sosnowskyi]